MDYQEILTQLQARGYISLKILAVSLLSSQRPANRQFIQRTLKDSLQIIHPPWLILPVVPGKRPVNLPRPEFFNIFLD